MSYCASASCLAHRERVFWNPYFAGWTHVAGTPCTAMADEPDPTLLTCAYCGQRTEVDGAGRLWTYEPDAPGHWDVTPAGAWYWRSAAWNGRCVTSSTGEHEVLGTSQASGLA